MTALTRQKAAQAQYDSMSPPEPDDLLNGQVDLSDSESISDFIAGDDSLAEAIREASVSMLAMWMDGPKDSYAIDSMVVSVNRMARTVSDAAEKHNAAIEKRERDIAEESRWEAFSMFGRMA